MTESRSYRSYKRGKMSTKQNKNGNYARLYNTDEIETVITCKKYLKNFKQKKQGFLKLKM